MFAQAKRQGCPPERLKRMLARQRAMHDQHRNGPPPWPTRNFTVTPDGDTTVTAPPAPWAPSTAR